MSDTPLKVFVVDDDPAMRNSLPRALRKRGFEVDVFASAPDFLTQYDGTQPGCLVIDLRMPEMSGLELQERLGAEGQFLPMIFISGHGGVRESVQAMKGGAMDFIEKPFRSAALVERIEAAFALLRERLEMREKCVELRQRFERLTAREAEIVSRIVACPAEISSKEIGRHLGISPRTIDHHRARILEKLEIRSTAELVGLATRLRIDCEASNFVSGLAPQE
ncbi:response regulator transcription factor [Aliiruegeria lutimaris]|uniref:Two component transcriptional regulator, LuxR family n=1 Tax=Aliiruegeria lutimaris TaxID=571298 RepID=A0A1G9KRC8_9RHOB|nr:response regulator [Aliiruegeria lutimaris]SDL52400.1 two component transcriptional regulator, LuxR family [Aliiruegeria lutimaris]